MWIYQTRSPLSEFEIVNLYTWTCNLYYCMLHHQCNAHHVTYVPVARCLYYEQQRVSINKIYRLDSSQSSTISFSTRAIWSGVSVILPNIQITKTAQSTIDLYCLSQQRVHYTSPDNTIVKLFSMEKIIIYLVHDIPFQT